MKTAKTVFFICHIEIYYFYVRNVYDFKKFKLLTSSASTLERKKNNARSPPHFNFNSPSLSISID